MRVKELLEIAKEAQKKDDDTNYIVIGRTRTGKSTFVLHCMEYLRAKDTDIAMYPEEVATAIRSAGVEGAWMFDEAIEGIESKEGQSRFNRELEKLFLITAGNKMITFLIIPVYKLVASVFREDIIDGLFFVYARGKVMYYSSKKLRAIHAYMERHKGKFGGAKPSFKDHFPLYRGYLAKSYMEKKNKKLTDALASFEDRVKKNKETIVSKRQQIVELVQKGWKPSEIAKELKVATSYISECKNRI